MSKLGGDEIKLTEAQRRVLRDAARDLHGERTCHVGPGGARAAKALEALGLGTYYRRTQRGSRFNREVSPSRFVIREAGIDALDLGTDHELKASGSPPSTGRAGSLGLRFCTPPYGREVGRDERQRS
jgi:hypothetical protein